MNKEYPSLEEIIYESKTPRDFWEKTITALRAQGTLNSLMYANTLETFWNMLNTVTLKELNDEFNELKVEISEWAKENQVRVDFYQRQKDFVGLNKKIRLYIKQNKPLSRIKDFLGFRIVIDSDKGEEENIRLCYDVLLMIINFFVRERHCIIVEAEPVLDVGKYEGNLNIIIPTQNYLPKQWENNVKDYIKNPKKNGYQSLHSIFKKPNILFEVQIRTAKMHEFASQGTAHHGKYKDCRYGDEKIELDLNKIHVEGFEILPDGTISDKAKLLKSGNPFD